MVKSLTEALRRELSTHGLELLDIYVFRDKDVLRLLNKRTNSVQFYISQRRLSSITSTEDIKTIVSEIKKSLEKS
jgi:hypothetical protein